MRRSFVTLLTITALTALVVGCSSGSDKASSSATTTSTSAATSSTTATTTPNTTGPVSSTHCTTAQLSGSLGQSQSGAGQRYQAVVLTNTGSKVCDLRGFPGASLLDSSANQIGQPAGREGPEGATINIEPGGTVSTTLHTSAPGLGPTCEPTSAQIKIYPPDNTVALTIPAAYTSCGGFHVTTMVAGSAGR